MTRVVQLLDQWLPRTQPWLATTMRSLPASIESTIVARRLTSPSPTPPAPLTHVPRLAGGRIGQVIDVVAPGFEPGRLAPQVAALHPEVIHAHFGAAGWDARTAAARARCPFVVSFYGLDADALPSGSRRWRDRYRRIFDEAAFVLALGPWMADTLTGHGADPERMVIHHLGVPVGDIAFVARQWDGRRPLRVLIASSFREKKGIPIALAALAELRQRVPISITLVGDATDYGPEHEERARILSTIERRGLGDAVRRLGFVSHDELLRLAAEHDLFVAASRTAADGDTEGTPMALVELAATGIVIVTTRHADIPEIVVDGRTGFLADEGDLASLVAALERAVEHADAWSSVGWAGREHVGTGFDAVVQGRRLAGLYERAVRVPSRA